MPKQSRLEKMADAIRKEQPGIKCRKCGCCNHNTIRTRHRLGGVIRRLRECRHCGHRFYTAERNVT